MPPSSQPIEEITMSKLDKETVNELTAHMQKFVFTMQDALKDFIKPLDPTEGEDEMAYIRAVVEAVDNVVATALMVKEDPIAMAALEVSTDLMIAQLVEFHTKGEVKH